MPGTTEIEQMKEEEYDSFDDYLEVSMSQRKDTTFASWMYVMVWYACTVYEFVPLIDGLLNEYC